ncbi:MAG: hypothetical protein L6Q37_00860, partial [Bdellovibrionaceae bacterium]|nr:hypothetical protein [Pseudobdellovibrionaceae bacterium]
GRQLYENSELVRNNSDRDIQYELSQSYAPVPAYVKIAGELKSIYRGNTSTGGVKRDSRPYIFLNSSLESSLNTLKNSKWMILSEKTYEEFQNFLSSITQDLKLQLNTNLSNILNRMEKAQDRRNIFVPSRIDRLKNFLFRRKSIEQLTPEEIVIQQRIEHAEKLVREN